MAAQAWDRGRRCSGRGSWCSPTGGGWRRPSWASPWRPAPPWPPRTSCCLSCLCASGSRSPPPPPRPLSLSAHTDTSAPSACRTLVSVLWRHSASLPSPNYAPSPSPRAHLQIAWRWREGPRSPVLHATVSIGSRLRRLSVLFFVAAVDRCGRAGSFVRAPFRQRHPRSTSTRCLFTRTTADAALSVGRRYPRSPTSSF